MTILKSTHLGATTSGVATDGASEGTNQNGPFVGDDRDSGAGDEVSVGAWVVGEELIQRVDVTAKQDLGSFLPNARDVG